MVELITHRYRLRCLFMISFSKMCHLKMRLNDMRNSEKLAMCQRQSIHCRLCGELNSSPALNLVVVTNPNYFQYIVKRDPPSLAHKPF